jgi:hypothetical protein
MLPTMVLGQAFLMLTCQPPLFKRTTPICHLMMHWVALWVWAFWNHHQHSVLLKNNHSINTIYILFELFFYWNIVFLYLQLAKRNAENRSLEKEVQDLMTKVQERKVCHNIFPPFIISLYFLQCINCLVIGRHI